MNNKIKIMLGICSACLLLAACAPGASKGREAQAHTWAAPVRHTEAQTQAAGSPESADGSEPADRILMHNGTLYYGTDETGPMGDSGAVCGRIVSSSGPDEIPAEDGQSNFGCIDNPYTEDYGDGFIMVFVDDEWFCFYTEQAGANATNEANEEELPDGQGIQTDQGLSG